MSVEKVGSLLVISNTNLYFSTKISQIGIFNQENLDSISRVVDYSKFKVQSCVVETTFNTSVLIILHTVLVHTSSELPSETKTRGQ